MIQVSEKTELEKNLDISIAWFKDYFGGKMVSEKIQVIAWMFFLNEYLMGYSIHGNTFPVFMKEIETMKGDRK